MKQNIPSPLSNRLEYIDIAKGIGILLVVIGHSIDGHHLPGLYISSFHMPLFFILSGLCFNESKYPHFIPFLEKRIKTLLLPLAYFTVIMLILSTLLLKEYYPLTKLTYKFPGATWFIFILFLSELFYYVTNRLLPGKKGKILFLTGCLFISAILHRKNITLPYNLCSIFIAIFFYGLGHTLKNNIISTITNVNKIIGILFLVIPALSVYFTKQSIDLNSNSLPFPEGYYCLIAIIGSMGILIASNKWFLLETPVKRILLFIGQNTLTILVLHMFFISLCSHYITPFISAKLLYKIIEQLLMWGLLFASISIINTKAKWLIGK